MELIPISGRFTLLHYSTKYLLVYEYLKRFFFFWLTNGLMDLPFVSGKYTSKGDFMQKISSKYTGSVAKLQKNDAAPALATTMAPARKYVFFQTA
jgi:hypothetical protein